MRSGCSKIRGSTLRSASARRRRGISHLGIQAEDQEELTEVYDRLSRAERPIVEAKATTCCYAKSDKQWIADPQGVPWETFFTYGEATVYGEGSLAKLREATERAVCCEPSIAELTPEPAAARPAARRPAAPARSGSWLTRPTTSSFSARATRPGASWPKRFSITGARAGSRPTAPAAFPRAPCTPWRSTSSKSPISRHGGLRSKSWDEFAKPGAPEMDFVFTVCDQAANEACPVWPGNPVTAHWGVPDPAAVEGAETTKAQSFPRSPMSALETRIKLFTSLRLEASIGWRSSATSTRSAICE